jgi:DNA polymerase II large subunit
MAKMTRRAQWGERLRWLARKDVFERLMRQHYLRGLREGLSEAKQLD